jgi:hypothetical protein
MSTNRDEITALIAELEAQIPNADPQTRALLVQQIQSMRQVTQMVQDAQPAIAEVALHRPALSPQVQAFFTPDPPAQVPAWLPDTLSRAEAHEGLLRCPPGAQVYVQDDGLSCALSGQRGASLSVAHGLTLGFFKSGKLHYQRFYESGLLRWSIEYHAAGGRESVGFYTSREPKTYLEHGLITRFTSTGTVTSQASFWHGVRHGWSKLWEEDGFPISATLYNNGREVEQVYPNGERRQV